MVDHLRRGHGAGGDDEVAEAGGEALDLRGDALGRVGAVPGRCMRIGPQRSQPVPDPARVDHGRVADQGERTVGEAPGGDLRLGAGHLGAGAAQMLGPGTADVGIPPRHRPGEHEVDLRGAVPVGDPPQHRLQGAGETVGEDVRGGGRGDVQQHGAGRGHVPPGPHMVPGGHGPAVGAQVRHQRVDDRLGAADGDRPAHSVRDGAQQRGGGAEREGGQLSDRVRRHPGEQGAGALGAEGEVPGRGPLEGEQRTEQRGGAQGPRGQQRGGHRALVPEGELDDEVLVAGERAQQRAPGRPVGAEAVGGPLHVPPGDRGGGVVERLRVGGLGGDRAHAAGGEVELREEGAGEREGVHRGAEVVDDAGREAQVEGARPAADRLLRLEDMDRETGPGQGDRGRETVRAGAHDDDVRLCGGRGAHACQPSGPRCDRAGRTSRGADGSPARIYVMRK